MTLDEIQKTGKPVIDLALDAFPFLHESKGGEVVGLYLMQMVRGPDGKVWMMAAVPLYLDPDNAG